jgi:hypothetical protein
MYFGFIQVFGCGFALDSKLIMFGEVFSIFFMQHWGTVNDGMPILANLNRSKDE